MRSAREALIPEPSQLSSLGQMPSDRRKADAELSATSRAVVSGPASKAAAERFLSTPGGPTGAFHLQGLVSLAKLPEPRLHDVLISSSWAKCVVDVVNSLGCFTRSELG